MDAPRVLQAFTALGVTLRLGADGVIVYEPDRDIPEELKDRARAVRFQLAVLLANGHHAANGNGGADDSALATDPGELTEDALASEFTRRHQDALRYVNEWGKWLRWDGQRWAPERTLAVYDLARQITRDVTAKVVNQKIAARIQAAATVNAIVSLARCDRAHARVSEDFDADPWLLNTPAGTIDLRTGEMHGHRRQDGITKITTVAPNDGLAPHWGACLATWTNKDAELIAFLQRLCGYWLTGSVREEKLVFIYGLGGNGKSKFMEAVRGTVGDDYVTGLAMETLMAASGDQHPTDVADLRGKRLPSRRSSTSLAATPSALGTCGKTFSTSHPHTRS
jgi:putative DNA primase/helicase